MVFYMHSILYTYLYDFRLQPVQQNDNGRPPSPERDDCVVFAALAVLATSGVGDGATSGDVFASSGVAPATAETQFRRGILDGTGRFE